MDWVIVYDLLAEEIFWIILILKKIIFAQSVHIRVAVRVFCITAKKCAYSSYCAQNVRAFPICAKRSTLLMQGVCKPKFLMRTGGRIFCTWILHTVCKISS